MISLRKIEQLAKKNALSDEAVFDLILQWVGNGDPKEVASEVVRCLQSPTGGEE